MAAENNLIEVIIGDHREAKEAFQQLEQRTQAPTKKRELVDHVVAELVRHPVAEEQYMYPVTREVLSDGNDTADRRRAEDQDAERVMTDLDGLNSEDARSTTCWER